MKTTHDSNGNKVIKFEKSDLGGATGFSIQTLGNLPETHRNGICPATDKEVRTYIKNYGSDRQKELFGIS